MAKVGIPPFSPLFEGMSALSYDIERIWCRFEFGADLRSHQEFRVGEAKPHELNHDSSSFLHSR
ncbi:hypothetical protein SOVF_209480 isoform A [Spinacia oleracea]|nr:hypothetical protein SOVF_209480 isoform A [Spinacia oleracea]